MSILKQVNIKDTIYDLKGNDLYLRSPVINPTSKCMASFEFIKTLCKEGDLTGLHVGDTLTFTVDMGSGTSDTFTARIMGLDTYYKQTNVHHVDFITDEVFAQQQTWGFSSYYNNGTSSQPYPYLLSQHYSLLNNTIFPKLEQKLQNVISDRLAFLEKRYVSGSQYLTESNGIASGSLGKLWLPSEYEVFGNCTYGTDKYSCGGDIQYELFKGSNKFKSKSYQGKYINWALRTLESGNYYAAVGVDGYGKQTSLHLTYSPAYLPLCFRISGGN